MFVLKYMSSDDGAPKLVLLLTADNIRTELNGRIYQVFAYTGADFQVIDLMPDSDDVVYVENERGKTVHIFRCLGHSEAKPDEKQIDLTVNWSK